MRSDRLLAIATLADRGVRDVVAVDTSRRRLELAQQFGAAHQVNPSEVDVWDELARCHGTAPFMLGPTPATDVFIEASGSDRVLAEILEQGGRADACRWSPSTISPCRRTSSKS